MIAPNDGQERRLELSKSMLEQLAGLIADLVSEKIAEKESRVLISREELATLTGLGMRTIDRMAAGGSWEINRQTKEKVWKPSAVKLEPQRVGTRVMFDKAAALAVIKQANCGKNA